MTDFARAIEAVRRGTARTSGYALVGGYAVSIRTEPRFTRDIDFVVAVDDADEAEDLIQRLVGDGFAATAVVEEEAFGRLATVRLRDDDLLVDMLFASSGIEHEIVAAAEEIEVLPRSGTHRGTWLRPRA